MTDIFISYASEDRERAHVIADALSEHGWTVWWDRQIPPGKSWDEVIEQALHSARCALVLWSESSIKSHWVKAEASEAAGRGRLVPALIDKVKVPLEFRRMQAADLTEWQGDTDDPEFRKFLDAVAEEIERANAAGDAQPAGMERRDPGGEIVTAATRAAQTLRRWRRPINIGLPAVLLIAAAAYWLGGHWFGSVTVPNVIGKHLAEAASELGKTGLSVRGDPESLETQDEKPDHVIAQNPDGGAAVAREVAVALTVARPMPSIPAVIGEPLTVASRLLDALGFSIGPIELKPSDRTENTVIDQSPAAEQRHPSKTKVLLTIARPIAVAAAAPSTEMVIAAAPAATETPAAPAEARTAPAEARTAPAEERTTTSERADADRDAASTERPTALTRSFRVTPRVQTNSESTSAPAAATARVEVTTDAVRAQSEPLPQLAQRSPGADGSRSGGKIVRDIDAGYITSDADARETCPRVCKGRGGTWTGRWMTIIPGTLCVCGCEFVR